METEYNTIVIQLVYTKLLRQFREHLCLSETDIANMISENGNNQLKGKTVEQCQKDGQTTFAAANYYYSIISTYCYVKAHVT